MTATSDAPIETLLRQALPADRFGGEAQVFAVDGLPPGVVVAPTDVDEVAAVLRVADAAGAAVVPWGSGARIALGQPPRRYDVALDLRGLDRIVEYEPEDLTVTAQAGVLLSTLQQRLAAERQWLPLDPLADGALGGILATNDSGPARVAHGGVRDLVIGLQVVLANGEIVNSGGRVVKNVAGYDMTKLHLGALGTLGVIVQATFKVAPLPAVQEMLLFSGPRDALSGAAFRIRDAGLAVNGLTLSGSEGQWRLAVRLAGGASAVARSQRDVDAIAASLGLQPAEALPLPDAALSLRAGVQPTAAGRACDALLAAGATVVAYPTVGTLRASWPADRLPRFDQLAELRRFCVVEGNGALLLERIPTAMKQQIDVWGGQRNDFELMRRLKQQFDPNGVLNPGRYLGGL